MKRTVTKKAAPVASREREEEAARSAEAAREYVSAQLLNAKGLRLLKHGRNRRSAYRKLTSPDGDCRTISWGKESHDLKTMQEVCFDTTVVERRRFTSFCRRSCRGKQR